MKKTLKNVMLLIVAGLVLTITAPNVFAQDDAATDDATEEMEETIEESEIQAALKEAIEIFQEEHPDAELGEINIEMRRVDNFKIEIHGFDDANDYYIHFRSHPVEIVEQETESENDQEEALDFDAYISMDEATDIALEEAGLGMVTKWELDHDEDADTFIWKLAVNDREADYQADISIDALTGDVLDVDQED